MDNKKVDISQSSLEKLLEKSLDNFQEERDLALERYRRQDEMMTSADDFVLQGKFAVDYLKISADRSNAIFGIAKFINDIVNKSDTGFGAKPGSSNGTANDSQKADILKLLKEIDLNKDDIPKTQ